MPRQTVADVAPVLTDAPARAETPARLVAAAMAEFNEQGFDGTDTNRIARRAGFAPQTFYRWFADKTAIFLDVYRDWEEQELAALASIRAGPDAALRMARVVAAHHRDYRCFRRSLRQLSYSHPAVREARCESRRRQVDRILAWAGAKGPSRTQAILLLLQAERISDALAETELADLGVPESESLAALAALIGQFQPGG